MAIKKSQLYNTLWESCNALRGGMDASQYKNYVLMILFVKYLSDKAHKGETKLKVPDECYFEDFVKLKNKTGMADKIDKKLTAIFEANTGYIKGLEIPKFDDDGIADDENLTKMWSNLIGEFQRDELDFSKNRAADDDLLGDAYEYLMKNFAAESGKSKGQFYTPAEVSRIIAKLLNLSELDKGQDAIYDPTCGSGSLLLRAHAETNGKPRLRGQESDKITTTLAKLNMLLHSQPAADIRNGDTLNDPKFTVNGGDRLETFDVCIANPPFSQKNWLSSTSTIGGVDDKYRRWSEELLPPAKCGDYAFLLHLIKSMKEDTGRGACILPHGVLFRGNAEYDIRKNIIDRHIIKGIIGLPANIFFGTGIPASIVVIDKKGASSREGIFFIDAKDGYAKDGAKNRLREQDIRLIIDTWNNHKDVPHYARFVTWSEIEKNDYNLNIPRYIKPIETEVVQDIEQHLKGNLPALDIDEKMEHYWEVFPNLKNSLFSKKTDNSYALKIDVAEIRNHITEAQEVTNEHAALKQMFDKWITNVFVPTVTAYKQGSFNPKETIESLGTQLLDVCKDGKLTNNYDVYEVLRNYWADVLQDDSYIIRAQGWKITPTPIHKKAKKKNAPAKLVGYSYDPLTDELLGRIYFPDILEELAVAEQKLSEAQDAFDSYVEENALGYFSDSRYNRFTVIKTKKKKKVEVPGECCKDCVERRMLEIVPIKPGKKNNDKRSKKISELQDKLLEEWNELQKYLDLYEAKTKASTAKSRVNTKLTNAIKEKQKYFADNCDKAEVETELKHLLIQDKWIYALSGTLEKVHTASLQQMISDVSDLCERYEHTLDELSAKATDLEAKVIGHLKQMGFVL